MSTKLWALLTIEQILTATGYKIIVTTNVPCHLYMRWTTVIPKEHIIPVERRGLFLHSDKYFCFVVYEDNQQEEAGDTITHTFIKEPWPFCETRWFYFWGTINGQTSPSTSPIFSKHRTAPPWGPPQTVEYPSLAYDGYLATWRGNPFLTYAENWIADEDSVWTAEPTLTLYNTNWGNSIFIYRGVLFFKTPALPANCKIDSAKVRLYAAAIIDPRLASICLTPATNVHTPLIPADYGNLRQTPTIIGSYPMDDMSVGSTFWIDLTDAGLDHITKAGITRFGLRIDNEIDANGCPDAHEYFRCRTYEQPVVGTHAIISVTYRLPA